MTSPSIRAWNIGKFGIPKLNNETVEEGEDDYAFNLGYNDYKNDSASQTQFVLENKTFKYEVQKTCF